MGADLQQAAGRQYVELAHQRGFFGIRLWQHEATTFARDGGAHRKRTTDAAQFAAQRQFASEFVAIDIACLELARGDQDAERNGQVEAARFLVSEIS